MYVPVKKLKLIIKKENFTCWEYKKNKTIIINNSFNLGKPFDIKDIMTAIQQSLA